MARRLLIVAAVSSLTMLAAGAAGDGTASDPDRSTAPGGTFFAACRHLYPLAHPQRCDWAALIDIDRARAQEGVGPVSLPAGFDRLSVRQQFWVLVNLERVDRGLRPAKALSPALNQLADRGAEKGADPPYPSPFTGDAGSGNWAGGYGTGALLNNFFWIYDDGTDSPNLNCQTSTDPGCWGHRHAILGRYDRPLLMGAGVAASDPNGDYGSVTELFIGGDTGDRPAALTWSAVKARLPVGVGPARVHLPGAVAGSAPVTVWASGEPMRVGFTVSGGAGTWSVDRGGCRLAAGTTCSPTVRYLPAPDGPARAATLKVRGPNGTRSVRLLAGNTPKLSLRAKPRGGSAPDRRVRFLLTVARAASAPLPTGRARFVTGGNVLCRGVRLTSVTGGSQARCRVRGRRLGTGTHTVTVHYRGDLHYRPGTASLGYRIG